MKLSIVIPVYNEEQTINEIVERVCAVDLGCIEKEVIIANDGSSDGTQAIIDASPWISDPRVCVCSNEINLGKGAAVRLGLKYATGDVIVIQDADLELDPAEFVRLIEPIRENRADVVYGSRFLRGGHGVSRRTRLANRLLTALTNLLFRASLTDMETAYKLFRRDVLPGLSLRAVGFDFEPEFTAKILLAGWRVVELPIAYSPRRVDEGKKIRWIDGLDAIYMLIKCRLLGRRR